MRVVLCVCVLVLSLYILSTKHTASEKMMQVESDLIRKCYNM